MTFSGFTKFKGLKYSLGDETVKNRPFFYLPCEALRVAHSSATPEEGGDIKDMQPVASYPRWSETRKQMLSSLDPAKTYTFCEWNQMADIIEWCATTLLFPWRASTNVLPHCESAKSEEKERTLLGNFTPTLDHFQNSWSF